MTKLMRKGNIAGNLIWSLKELYKFDKAYMFLFMLQAIINGVLPVISLVLIQQIINELQYQTGSLDQLVKKLLLMFLIQLICEVTLYYVQLRVENLELKFSAYFQAMVLKKVEVLDSKDFENTQTYNLINRTQYDGNAGILGTIKILFLLTSLIISTISYMVIIINYNILIFALMVILPVIKYFFEKKYNLEEYRLDIKNTEADRQTSYITFLLTNSENFKDIKSYNLSRYFIKKYEKIKDLFNQDYIDLNKKRTKTFSAISIIDKGVECLVMLVILIQTFSGIISIGDFILYNNSIDSLKENIMAMFSQISYIYKNSAMIEQIRLFFEIEPENLHKDGEKIDEIYKIELRDVSYRYQGKEEYALKNINLTLTKGDFTVLMGYNGSGKSTLIKIISGIYSDYEGEIFVNDINLKNVELAKYRESVSVMFQNYIKYESTILDNIQYGNLKEGMPTIARMLDKVVLPEFKGHLDQSLGYQFTEGTQISIGQWQKLALGRTLLKPADIYIYDEPNASLDIASERSVLNMLYEEMRSKITILIMHRFNCMVERADRIIVLEQGEIRERGTHEELLKNHDLYFKLYNDQKEMAVSDK